MSKSRGFFAKRKADKAKAARKAQWKKVGKDIETVSAGVTTVATVVSGVVAAFNWMSRDRDHSDREITRTEALNALSIQAQTAKAVAQTRASRKQARNTLKATERALESLALQRTTAEADYARAVYSGVQMYRSTPPSLPIWWPAGVS